jgi:hypothetical protein
MESSQYRRGDIKLSRKGFINVLELIFAALALVAAFTVLFPDTGYTSNWDYAQLTLRSRDTLATIDSMGRTYEYSFSSSSFNVFINNVFSGVNLITWHSTDGAVKNTVRIACACTDSQIQTIGGWLEGMKFNGRNVEFIIYSSSLSSIPSSDVLLIWGYRDLTPYRTSIQNYLGTGSGVVEVMDFTSTIQAVQTEIFGIAAGGGWGNDQDVFLKPANGKQLTYQAYKMFYHLPRPLKATGNGLITPTCTQTNKTGTFVIRSGILSPVQFWICNGNSVYFDTNADGVQDTGALHANDTFSIAGFNFKVKYIDSADQIRIEFENSPEYEFADFIMAGNILSVSPNNGDYSRALVVRTNPLPQKASGVILSNASAYRTAWIADFTRGGMNVGDDMKQLLTSVILWASNKKESAVVYNLRSGYVTSLVDVKNTDMMEVYKLEFGVGYPY